MREPFFSSSVKSRSPIAAKASGSIGCLLFTECYSGELSMMVKHTAKRRSNELLSKSFKLHYIVSLKMFKYQCFVL